jgi:hypothetical protein
VELDTEDEGIKSIGAIGAELKADGIIGVLG